MLVKRFRYLVSFLATVGSIFYHSAVHAHLPSASVRCSIKNHLTIVQSPATSNLYRTSSPISQFNASGSCTQSAEALSPRWNVNVYYLKMNYSDNIVQSDYEVIFNRYILGVYPDYDQALLWKAKSLSQAIFNIC